MADRDDKGIQVQDLDSWDKGLISYFSNSRMPKNALKQADNVVLDYNGVVKPRGSFDDSGIPDIEEGYEPLGCDTTFKRSNGSEGLINIFTDGTNGYVFTLNADKLGWKKHDLVFDGKVTPMFDQADNKVVIVNGEDKFTYYDIVTDKLVQFKRVEDPSVAPLAVGTGFTGTNTMDYYYKIAFNSVGGSTKMSPGKKISVPAIRENWTAAQHTTITMNNPVSTDAESWNIYIASVATGSGQPTDSEYLQLTEKIPITTTTFTDNGSTLSLRTAPVENSTEGVLAWYVKNISGRLWFLGAKDNKSVAYWGGDTGNELYVGTANGSDSFTVDNGGKERPMAIDLGRDNSGTTCINLLTATTAGQGAVWDVYATTNSVSAGEQTFSVGTYQFKKREGNDGTDAPYSVIHENNNIYYLSMEGFKSTGVKPNIAGIQSTDIVSSAIRDRVLNLNRNDLKKCFVAYYDESIYWTINYGGERNNEIWVYDILHGGVWSIFKIKADCILRWTSSENVSPSLYIRQGRKLLRYNKTSRTHTDYDGAFVSKISSGLIPFRDDFLTWVHLLKIVWQLNNAKGEIVLSLNVHSKNGAIIKNKVLKISDVNNNTIVGWGAIVNDDFFKGGWSNIKGFGHISKIYKNQIDTNAKVPQKVRKNINYYSFSITCSTPQSFYELSHVGALFTYVGEGVEFLSQKGMYKI